MMFLMLMTFLYDSGYVVSWLAYVNNDDADANGDDGDGDVCFGRCTGIDSGAVAVEPLGATPSHH